MSSSGWIKLHRRIKDKAYYKKSEYVHLWVHLLLKANHKSKEFMFNDKIMLINEGQLLTGRKQLSQETGISESMVERILKMFQNEQQIEQQTTNKFRIISIKNWVNYQNENNVEQQSEQQVNNQWTASEQPVDTNKNDKNVKNDKNNISFEIFWNEYDKKVGDKKKLIKKWNKLKEEEQLKILSHIKKYKIAQPDKQYRKNPETYLNNKSWNDEIVGRTNGTSGTIFETMEFRERAAAIAESIANDTDLK